MAANHNNGIRFTSLFNPSDIICCSKSLSRDELIAEMVRHLAKEYEIPDIDEIIKEIIKREEVSATIIAPGMAIPHTRLGRLDKALVCVATSEKGIYFGDNQVKLAILILAPKYKPGVYLQILHGIASACAKPDVVSRIVSLKSQTDIWQYFESGGHLLPAHLLAQHVMLPPETTLNENDTLAKAIDLFVKHKVSELPVTDSSGTLIGVVTANLLFRVCLPEYILWVEDISPFLNFEPFAEVMRNESKTWLSDIMTVDYAVVSESDPAFAAAKEIARKDTEMAYVVKDGKLLGVISLPGFLGRILRE